MATQEGLAYWASVTKANVKYEPVFTVDLLVDDKIADDFEAKGFTTKTLKSKEGEVIGRALKIRRKVNGPGGMIRKAPTLVDRNKVPIDVDVGNGSRVIVQFSDWNKTNQYGSFKGLDFQGMQVLDLISYSSGDGDEFEALEGGEEF